MRVAVARLARGIADRAAVLRLVQNRAHARLRAAAARLGALRPGIKNAGRARDGARILLARPLLTSVGIGALAVHFGYLHLSKR